MALMRHCVSQVVKTSSRIPTVIQTRNIKRFVAPTLIELKKREKVSGGKVVHPRNTFLEWNHEAELYGFCKRLNEEFDPDLLLQAFTDRSYVIQEETKQKEIGIDISIKDNHELAKEGESFITQYVQLYLETVLPKFPLEGIRAVRDHLLSEATLAHVSLHLGTKDIILAKQYPVEPYILVNTLKAIVGALLQSSGELRAAHFVRDFVVTQLQGQDVNAYWDIEDPWGMLVELVEKRGNKVEPRLLGDVAKNTLLACYRVGIYMDKAMISAGYGEDIAAAKEMAAREALKKVFGTEEHMSPINFKLHGIPKPASDSRYQIIAS